jgi:hypothetical protein
MRSRNQLVSPRKAERLSASAGSAQFTTAVSFAGSGWTPLGPTVAPANTAVVMKSSDLPADSESFLSLILMKIVVSFVIISSNVSAAVPPSSTNSSMTSHTRRSCRCCAVICANVDGAPVSPNGILAYQK